MQRKKQGEVKLDKEELELSQSLDNDEWSTVKNLRNEKAKAKKAAENYFRTKEKRICIRVFSDDLDKIKEIARDDGLPYQTLVTSILHKYATGRFREANVR